MSHFLRPTRHAGGESVDAEATVGPPELVRTQQRWPGTSVSGGVFPLRQSGRRNPYGFAARQAGGHHHVFPT